MDTITLLQHYWWLIISLLGALLVFLMFVQGGQALLYTIGRTEEERNMLVNSLGRKWEFTFTTLVTFGGAFFASFPLFYSTSFGGAGTVLTVLALLLCAGWNDTAYYPSLADMQSSLTIYNSSSSLFTLKVMSIVSLLIPFVAAYIWYAWRAMNRKPITREEIRGDDHQY